MPPTTFDLRDPAFLADPYPFYGDLRENDPAHRTTIGTEEVWVISRHRDVSGLFSSPLARMRPPGMDSPAALGDGPAARMWRGTMSMMDPPHHDRLRRLVARPFTRRRVIELRARIEQIVDEALDAVADRGHMDVMRDLALVVPMRVICDMLGIPEDDWDMLSSWTPDFLRMFLPDANTPEEMDACNRACQNFLDYFSALVERARREPGDDIVSLLATAGEDGEQLSHDELVSTLRGLLTAGFETTMSTIGGGVYCLIAQPEQQQLLRERPELIAPAVDEFLRWESPVQAQIRYFADDVEVAGVTIPAGQKTMLLIGSANHDPERFVAPQRADVTRTDVDHMSFGGGVHYCCGAHLARQEVEVAIRGMLERFDGLAFATDSFARRAHFQFRPLNELPVTFTTAA